MNLRQSLGLLRPQYRVKTRSVKASIWFCFSVGAVFGTALLIGIFHWVILPPVLLSLLGTATFLALGFFLRSVFDDESHTLLHIQSRADELQVKLEEQKTAIDDMADGLDIAIFICDQRANILYANRRAIELFRFDRPTGRNILAVTLSYDLEQLVIRTGKDRIAQNAELTFTDPEEKVGLAKAWATSDGGDRVFLSVYEITDLRRLERVRQDFVANVSHELRTPLTIIRSMAETLVDDGDDLNERAIKYLNKIIAEVDRLTLISQDLLILSAAESNPIRKQRCDISDVFKGIVQQLESKAKKKGLDLTFSGPPQCVIEANSSQMMQVALNLVDNAIKYTTEGFVSVKVEPEEDVVKILISDSGIGIPSDQMGRIFERFYRVDRARSRATGGTGLGLSIVKHLTEAHGGKITVESALNVGSTFIVELPIGG